MIEAVAAGGPLTDILKPAKGDRRQVALLKAAIARLMTDKLLITRATITTAAGDCARERGWRTRLSRSTTEKGAGRAIYLACRTWAPARAEPAVAELTLEEAIQAIAPSPTDTRTAATFKATMRVMVAGGERISRATAAARSRTIGVAAVDGRAGFAETTLDREPYRPVYAALRAFTPTLPPRTRGALSPHIARMTKNQIARSLMLTRQETETRLAELDAAAAVIAASGLTFGVDAVTELRRERDNLPLNRNIGPPIARAHNEERQARSTRLTRAAISALGGAAPTFEAVARLTRQVDEEGAGLHSCTVTGNTECRRLVETARDGVDAIAKPKLPSAFSRARHRDLGLTLQTERALHNAALMATLRAGDILIDLQDVPLREQTMAMARRVADAIMDA